MQTTNAQLTSQIVKGRWTDAEKAILQKEVEEGLRIGLPLTIACARASTKLYRSAGACYAVYNYYKTKELEGEKANTTPTQIIEIEQQKEVSTEKLLKIPKGSKKLTITIELE